MKQDQTERYVIFNQIYQDLKQKSETKAVKELYRLADLSITQDFKIFKTKVVCQKGCSFCCSIPVDVSESEVSYILNHVEKKGVKINFKNRDKKNPANSKFETCVFLDTEKKTCKIYEARPMACRKHFVTTTSDHCKDLSEKIGRYYPFDPLIISQVLYNSSRVGNLNKLVQEKFNTINTLAYKVRSFLKSL